MLWLRQFYFKNMYKKFGHTASLHDCKQISSLKVGNSNFEGLRVVERSHWKISAKHFLSFLFEHDRASAWLPKDPWRTILPKKTAIRSPPAMTIRTPRMIRTPPTIRSPPTWSWFAKGKKSRSTGSNWRALAGLCFLPVKVSPRVESCLI